MKSLRSGRWEIVDALWGTNPMNPRSHLIKSFTYCEKCLNISYDMISSQDYVPKLHAHQLDNSFAERLPSDERTVLKNCANNIWRGFKVASWRIVQIIFGRVSKLPAEELCKLYLKGFQSCQLSSEILPRRIEDTERPSEQRNKRFADKLLLSSPPIQFHPKKCRNTEFC